MAIRGSGPTGYGIPESAQRLCRRYGLGESTEDFAVHNGFAHAFNPAPGRRLIVPGKPTPPTLVGETLTELVEKQARELAEGGAQPLDAYVTEAKRRLHANIQDEALAPIRRCLDPGLDLQRHPGDLFERLRDNGVGTHLPGPKKRLFDKLERQYLKSWREVDRRRFEKTLRATLKHVERTLRADIPSDRGLGRLLGKARTVTEDLLAKHPAAFTLFVEDGRYLPGWQAALRLPLKLRP